MRRKGIAVCTFLLWAIVAEVSADQPADTPKPLVILTELSAPHGDAAAEQLAATITSSIGLDMRLTGDLRVKRVDFLAPTAAFDRAKRFYDETHADGAVFGSVRPARDGRYSISLTIWSASATPGRTRNIKRTVGDLFSSFSIVDRLSLQVASTIVRKHLSEGRLVARGVGRLPHYAVYADGRLLGRDRSSFQVLTGSRTIIIAKPEQVGDVPLDTFHVTILAGKTTTVTLPPASVPIEKTKTTAKAAAGGPPPSLPLIRLVGNEPIDFRGRIYPAGFFGDYSGIAAVLSESTAPPSLRGIIAHERRRIIAGRREQIVGYAIAAAGGAAAAVGATLAVRSPAASRSLDIGVSAAGVLGSVVALFSVRAGHDESFGAVQAIAGAWNTAATGGR